MAEASAPEKITHPGVADLNEQAETKIEPKKRETVEGEAEEEEEETCAFCQYMKAGGCKAPFQSWMDCIDAEKAKGNDFVETCMTQIQDLRECMLANADYYRPMLEDEQQYLEEKESQRDSGQGDVTGDAV